MKQVTWKKLTTLTLIAVMLVATLTGCGKVAGKSRKNFTGFYLKETTRGKFDRSIAFSVESLAVATALSPPGRYPRLNITRFTGASTYFDIASCESQITDTFSRKRKGFTK